MTITITMTMIITITMTIINSIDISMTTIDAYKNMWKLLFLSLFM